MCLDSVDERTKRTPGIGYKVVEKVGSRYLCWDFSPMSGEVEYPLNRWIEDSNTDKKIGRDSNSYKPGFHVLLEQPSYEFFEYLLKHNPEVVAIMVRFKNVVASGQDYGPTVVARKIINKGEVPFVRI